MANAYVIGTSAPLATSAPSFGLPDDAPVEMKYKRLLLEYEDLQRHRERVKILLTDYISDLENAHEQIKNGSEKLDMFLKQMHIRLNVFF